MGAGMVICLGQGADLHMAADATATHCLLLQKIQIGSDIDSPG